MERVGKICQKFLCWFGYLLLTLFSADVLAAQSCDAFKLTSEALRSWYNPHPASSDFMLPLPLGMSLVFVTIPLSAQGLYGNEKSTYIMGSSESRLFETNLEVRVGSSISSGDESRILFGKYEVSKAQFVAVMGKGDMAEGIGILLERTKDPNAQEILSEFVEGKCAGILTRKIHNFLSEPLTFLSYRDYVDFLDTYNTYCISRNDCRVRLSKLGRNENVPGFVRLPAEHEWEFVARGGREFVKGKISKSEFQSDLPRVEPGTTIKHHAHIESDPPRTLPIGSRAPLFGTYDMLGNAQELMLNPFTAENGYGAVGAYVARGGHFRLTAKELRVSRRVELQAFRFDELSNSFVIQYFPLTGIRVVVGYPVLGASERIGDASLLQDFIENYEPPGEAGDIAGDTLADARDVGTVTDNTVSVRDELSEEDGVDFFKLSLRDYSRLSISILSVADIEYEVTNESQESILKGKSDGQTKKSNEILPGDYWVRLTPTRRLKSEHRYQMSISRSIVPDTGLARPDLAAFDSSSRLISLMTFIGYVGSGDTVDTYPILDMTNKSGMEFSIEEINSAVTLTYLDEKLNKIRRIEIAPNEKNKSIRISSKPNQKGFIQVSASANSATKYVLNVVAKAPFNREFLKNRPSSTYSLRFATEKVSYEGQIDDTIPTLYLPIKINERRQLRIELTNLSMDIDLIVQDSEGKSISSSHIRKGTAPEFFSQPVAEGVYFAVVRRKSKRDSSNFNLLYSTEKVKVTSAQRVQSLVQSISENLGTLGSSGLASFDTLVSREIKYYEFRITSGNQALLVEFDYVSPFSRTKFSIEDQNGRLLAEKVVTGTGLERINVNVSRGTHFLKVENLNVGPIFVFYSFVLSSKPRSSQPNLSGFGSYVETHNDFSIYRDGSTCYMVTVAKYVEPEFGWRKEKPYFVIAVRSNSDLIGIAMDNADQIRNATKYSRVTASVEHDGSIFNPIPAEWDGNDLQPIDSQDYIDNEVIDNFVRGNTLRIHGFIAGGRAVQIDYSLIGYTKAAMRINQLCDANAYWIWR